MKPMNVMIPPFDAEQGKKRERERKKKNLREKVHGCKGLLN